MASKTILISNETLLNLKKRLVYADLAMQSIPATIYLRQIYDNSNAIAALSIDFSTNADLYVGDLTGYTELTDTDKDYVLGEFSNENETGRLTFLDGTKVKSNTENLKYNEQARLKAHWKLDKNINVIAVKLAIRNIFSWIPGERILNPEFGSNLRQYLYEGITDFNKEKIMAEIRHCLTEWEPRVLLENVFDVSTTNDHENNTVKIEVQYSIPSLSPLQYSYIYETLLAE